MKESFPMLKPDEARNGHEALELVKGNDYVLCLLDLNMPGTDAIDLLKKFRIIQSGMRILVISMNSEDVYGVSVLKYGAMGFISKEQGYAEIGNAIKKVMDNKKYMSEKLISLLLDPNLSKNNTNPFSKLSEREMLVAKLICEGYSTKDIGKKIGLQLSTISTYKSKIFEKLKVENVVELIEKSRIYRILGE